MVKIGRWLIWKLFSLHSVGAVFTSPEFTVTVDLVLVINIKTQLSLQQFITTTFNIARLVYKGFNGKMWSGSNVPYGDCTYSSMRSSLTQIFFIRKYEEIDKTLLPNNITYIVCIFQNLNLNGI